ncbi:histidinol-phosphate transaminase [Haloimpatiens sp. FM7330]|uniref:histidinol-phosphate transaminase n=1 Tax=Haloimpatiens sp. FM7330 TaxID=3298610 RepID=UPI00363A6A73
MREKESIRNLKGYEACQIPFEIKLDANEGKNILLSNLYEEGLILDNETPINLYPDNDAILLKKELSKYLNVSINQILVGNGSSEMIELIIKTFVDKDETILSFTPSFSMYKIYAQIYGANFVEVNSNDDFSLDMKKMIKKAKEIFPKVIFICNPNNPTGYLIDLKDIKNLLEETDALVVVDEAYIEFAEKSILSEIERYENLIVLRTLSKAFGLAGIRVGSMISNEELIDIMKKVVSPYHLNSISQYLAVKALQNKENLKPYIEEIKLQRIFLYKSLQKLGMKVVPSYANFLFFQSDIKDLYNKLVDKGVLIRKFSDKLSKYFRVSIGDPSENKKFIGCLKEIVKNENG